jgi:hypothetical protein
MIPVLRLYFEAAGPSSPAAGGPKGLFNCYIGRGPSGWGEQARAYETISYQDMYPGVDLTVTGGPLGCLYRFALDPGASAGLVRIRIAGDPTEVSIQPEGSLRIVAGEFEFTEEPPLAYQLTPSGRQDLPAAIVLYEETLYGFEVSGADPSLPLFLDMTPCWSTGAGPFEENYNSIALCEDGNVVIAGSQLGYAIPFIGDPYVLRRVQDSAFAAMLTPAKELQWCTILDGIDGGDTDANDYCRSVATGSGGSIWLTGESHSYDFPMMNPFSDQHHGTNMGDVFITRLGARGVLEFSSYLGGSSHDVAYDIDVDKRGNAWIAGFSDSWDFPTPNSSGAHVPAHNREVFVSKVTAAGVLAWGYCFGGSDRDSAQGIAVDRAFNVWVTGSTKSADFPVRPGFSSGSVTVDAFVARLNEKRGLIWASRLGGSRTEGGRDVMVDRAGLAWLAGYTSSDDFPIKRGFDAQKTGTVSDGYLVRVSRSGRLMWSSYVGAEGEDEVMALCTDRRGNIYMTGLTQSSDLPGVPDSAVPLGANAFVVKLRCNGKPQWSRFYSTGDNWYPTDIVARDEDDVWVAYGY